MFFLSLPLIVSCSNEKPKFQSKLKADPIQRKQDDHKFELTYAPVLERSHYPWESQDCTHFPRITKEFFRCKGSSLNPVKITIGQKGEIDRHYDCGGTSRHSLPLKDQKEYIYPILIDILNYLQVKTGKRAVITSGHRCPVHNTYVDDSVDNRYSKHMIGAEVAFYIQGLEHEPDSIVQMILDYYKSQPKYQGLAPFQEFERYDNAKTNVSTAPWLNKEIFIKLYKSEEGRNFDNRHPYPYISLQVRYDWDTEERVPFSIDAAHRNYLRW